MKICVYYYGILKRKIKKKVNEKSINRKKDF